MNAPSIGLRILFAGTPEFAAAHLQALLKSHHQVIGVYTQPDRPAGRGKKLTPSAVKQLALEHDVPVYQPASLKSTDEQSQLASLNADVMVVVAYGLLLPKAVLDAPRFGCLNVHGSLLPRWRGAAPIQRAVAAGDKQSGITIMQMDEGLDTGDMLIKASYHLTADETSASLHDQLMALGSPALLDALDRLARGQLKPEVQDERQATYAAKISKEEALIDWSHTAADIERAIRAYNPFPVAYSFYRGKRIKVYAASIDDNSYSPAETGTVLRFDEQALTVQCQDGPLAIKSLQLPGKKAMDVAAVFNGNRERFILGERFGD